MNLERTLCAHGNPAESIDETNEQGPKGLIAARARRCSTCGVVPGFFDEQVPPPLIAWCFRAALFPGGTASTTHSTLTMSCCRALGSVGGGTCFCFCLSFQAIHSRLLLPCYPTSSQVLRYRATRLGATRLPEIIWHRSSTAANRYEAISRAGSTRKTLPCQMPLNLGHSPNPGFWFRWRLTTRRGTCSPWSRRSVSSRLQVRS
jgi:hypothetical protein